MVGQRGAFEEYLRSGRVRPRLPIEIKYNPWHDRESGKFTFEGSGGYFGHGQGVRADMARRPPATRAPLRGGGGSFGGGGATATGDWDPKKTLAKPRSKPALHGGSGGGGGATGHWGAPIPKPSRPVVVSPNSAAVVHPKPQPKAVLPTGWKRVRSSGFDYDIDEIGRTRRAEGTLNLAPAKRSRSAQNNAGKPDRQPKDDGGHYIAARFNGPAAAFNHFAQNATFNRGRYRALEDSWAKAIKRDQKVNVRIRPLYSGNSQRPDIIRVRYSIDGNWQTKVFRNRQKDR